MSVVNHDELKLAGDYFAGNIPIQWFEEVLKLPGAACRIAMLIWHYQRLRSLPVRVSMSKCRIINVERRARNAAIDALEKAGLIKVEAHSDRSPVVRVITGNHSTGQVGQSGE